MSLSIFGNSMRPLNRAELEQLKTFLRSLSLSHKAAAKELGVTPETLTSALSGRRIQEAKRYRILERTRTRSDARSDAPDLVSRKAALLAIDELRRSVPEGSRAWYQFNRAWRAIDRI